MNKIEKINPNYSSEENYRPGNLFNAKRDNDGKGIPIEDIREMLNVSP